MKSLNDIEESVKNFKVNPRSQMRSKVLDKALANQQGQDQRRTAGATLWRSIMKSNMTKCAFVLAIVIAIMIGITRFGGSVNLATKAFDRIEERMKLQPWVHAVTDISSLEGEGQVEYWIAFQKSIEIVKSINGNIRYSNSDRDEL